MKTVRLRPPARADIHNILDYLEQETGSNKIRRRFLVAFESTCRLLSTHPELGRCEDPAPAEMAEVRRFPVEHFDKYLVFYTLSRSTLHIVRVLHGSRDLATRFTHER
ncbi:MAG TPA: type II toxin-antitoxin system RelE/ParE family toxin [Acidobacteriaceae bacterium]|nr:type II toxin-antitoxin system RelE/ParE family toxin [Acidobacteriaceae bacterium]